MHRQSWNYGCKSGLGLNVAPRGHHRCIPHGQQLPMGAAPSFGQTRKKKDQTGRRSLVAWGFTKQAGRTSSRVLASWRTSQTDCNGRSHSSLFCHGRVAATPLIAKRGPCVKLLWPLRHPNATPAGCAPCARRNQTAHSQVAREAQCARPRRAKAPSRPSWPQRGRPCSAKCWTRWSERSAAGHVHVEIM